jgi:hypothetical protein
VLTDFSVMVELATKADLAAMQQRLQTELRNMRLGLRNSLDTQTLRLTINFGAMMVVWVVAAAIILKHI